MAISFDGVGVYFCGANGLSACGGMGKGLLAFLGSSKRCVRFCARFGRPKAGQVAYLDGEKGRKWGIFLGIFGFLGGERNKRAGKVH